MPQMSEEAKLVREKALAAAKARKEAEEAKRREAEERRRQQIEEQRRKREEDQAAMRARQAARRAGSSGGAAAIQVPPVPSAEKQLGLPDESVPGVADVVKELKSAESKFNITVGGGCAVEFLVDWSFLRAAGFLSLNEDQRKTCVTYYLKSSLIDNVIGKLTYIATKDHSNVAREEIQSGLFLRVIFGYDMTNSINSSVCDSSYTRHYELAIRDCDLEARVNFDKRDSGLSNLEDKIDCALNIQVAESKAMVREQLDKIEQVILSKLGLAIQVGVDWSFTESDAFLGEALTQEIVPHKDIQRYKTVCMNIYNLYAEYILCSSAGLVQLCQDDKLYKEAVNERISTIIFTYDPANKVNSPIGGPYAKSWEMQLDSTTKVLRITSNLSAVLHASSLQLCGKYSCALHLTCFLLLSMSLLDV